MLADQAEAFLVFRPQRVFEKEQVVGLELLRKARRFHGHEFLVHVVEQFDFFSERRAQVREELGHGAQVRSRLEEFSLRQVGLLRDAARDLFGFLPRGGAVSSLQAGNGHLRAHALEAAFDGAARGVFDLGEIAAARVRVAERSHARAPAQQLINGHARALALDVPQRQVHPSQRRHLHRTAAPIGAAIEVLPGVFDGFGVAPDEQRRQVLFERRRHGQLAAVQCGVTHAVKPRLAREDFHQDVIAVGTGDDDTHVGDLERRQVGRGCGWRRRSRRRAFRQGRRGERGGSGKFQESPPVRGVSLGWHRTSCVVTSGWLRARLERLRACAVGHSTPGRKR